MDDPHICGATRRELFGGAAVVVGGALFGLDSSTPHAWAEDADGYCGTEYDEEYEQLLAAADDFEDDDSDRFLAPAAWGRPIRRRARVTMRYRVRGNWLVGYHTGIDLAVPTGTPVYSVGSGTVVLARWSGSYGKAVTIKMRDSRYVLYAHLSRISVTRGSKVRAGTRIGSSGSTGRSTGPHLHFEVRARRGYGSDVDPARYLARHGLRL